MNCKQEAMDRAGETGEVVINREAGETQAHHVALTCRGCDPAEGFCRVCRDAEQRASSVAAPKGYKLVPINPTPEMEAVIKEVAPRWNAASIYANLLAAAPSDTSPTGSGK